MEKLCPVCNGKVIGRLDKVYCSVECQAAFNYEKSRKNEKLFHEIDKQLKTNRKLLKKHNRAGKTTLRRTELHNQGFNPNYFTHYWKNPYGEIYFFCYDYGFLKLKDNGKDKYLIVQWQTYMNKR